MPQSVVADKNKWFIEEASESKMIDKIHQAPNQLELDNIEINTDKTEVTNDLKNEEFIFDE